MAETSSPHGGARHQVQGISGNPLLGLGWSLEASEDVRVWGFLSLKNMQLVCGPKLDTFETKAHLAKETVSKKKKKSNERL